MNRYRKIKLGSAWVTIFLRSEDGNCILMNLATNTVPANSTIMNIMDDQRLVSPSNGSNKKVATIPAITASPMRNQYNRSILRLRSSMSMLLRGLSWGTSGGGTLLSSGDGTGSRGGVISSGVSRMGGLFFFLCFAKATLP